jgi:hypothetical protein
MRLLIKRLLITVNWKFKERVFGANCAGDAASGDAHPIARRRRSPPLVLFPLHRIYRRI